MANSIISFIDTTYIKTNSPMSKNVDEEVIAPILITAQEKYIIPVLGTHLYEDLQNVLEAYINSGTTISSSYITLINDYIKPLQNHYSLYELVPYLNYKMTNISVAKKASEFSQPTAVDEMNYLRNTIKSTAQFYADRLVKFLEANYATYPKYYEGLNKISDMYPEQGENFCGIYLGRGGN